MTVDLPETDYPQHFQTLSEEYPVLAVELAGLCGLGGVMGWMSRRGLSIGDVDIITLDEFSLDFVIPLGDGRHLVFGIT